MKIKTLLSDSICEWMTWYYARRRAKALLNISLPFILSLFKFYYYGQNLNFYRSFLFLVFHIVQNVGPPGLVWAFIWSPKGSYWSQQRYTQIIISMNENAKDNSTLFRVWWWREERKKEKREDKSWRGFSFFSQV